MTEKIYHGAGVFFPSALKKHESGTKSDSRTTVEHSTVTGDRVERYRRMWKKEGLVQVSFWLSEYVVAKLKARALKEGKKYSALADRIFKEALR